MWYDLSDHYGELFAERTNNSRPELPDLDHTSGGIVDKYRIFRPINFFGNP